MQNRRHEASVAKTQPENYLSYGVSPNSVRSKYSARDAKAAFYAVNSTASSRDFSRVLCLHDQPNWQDRKRMQGYTRSSARYMLTWQTDIAKVDECISRLTGLPAHGVHSATLATLSLHPYQLDESPATRSSRLPPYRKLSIERTVR